MNYKYQITIEIDVPEEKKDIIEDVIKTTKETLIPTVQKELCSNSQNSEVRYNVERIADWTNTHH